MTNPQPEEPVLTPRYDGLDARPQAEVNARIFIDELHKLRNETDRADILPALIRSKEWQQTVAIRRENYALTLQNADKLAEAEGVLPCYYIAENSRVMKAIEMSRDARNSLGKRVDPSTIELLANALDMAYHLKEPESLMGRWVALCQKAVTPIPPSPVHGLMGSRSL